MDTKNVDLNLLVALETLLAERNVTRAAKRLNISQPALSARLNRLRVLFNDPLLVPNRRGMNVTERALSLQEPLRQALDSVRGVVTDQRAFDPKTESASLTVAGSDYAHHAYLLPLVDALRYEAPGIRFAWSHLNFETFDAQLERGEIDFLLMPPKAASDRLRFRHLLDERYVVITRMNHPRVGRQLTLSKFCSLEHIVRSPSGGGFSGPTDEALEARNRTRNVVLSVPSWLIIPQIVRSTDLVAVVPERLVAYQNDELDIFELPLPVRGFAVAMLWHDRVGESQIHLWFRNRIAELINTV